MAKRIYIICELAEIRAYCDERNLTYSLNEKENYIELDNFDIAAQGMHPLNPGILIPAITWHPRSEVASIAENEELFNRLKQKFGSTMNAAI